MAKVSLRSYNREIENLVESGQLDEAIAHCRHVLNAFPKNLETYRLLGKAYLESKHYNEATDIFERVLMAAPDDFVSHVGMSIIHDEQNSMDAAIWHMERAFEVQPSNAAIQAELQRLYGRRDGIEPPKIRLTRGALAHMYIQGELYPQAISEIKSVLEEDPDRQDMQVLLARAYFHSGQKGEVAEICSQLLRRYPYCFDANRILVEMIPQSERGESTQVYRHRISELDPYSTFTTGSVFHSDEVADAAVSLERLEWDGQPIDMQPGWGDSLGIGLGEKPAARDEQPAWLRTAMEEDSLSASTSTEEPAPVTGAMSMPIPGDAEDEIPGFLREAGWGQSTGEFQEGTGSFDEFDAISAGGAIAEGDLPDWVKAMAPAGADTGTAPGTTEADLIQDDVPDWLQGLGDAQGVAPAEQPAAAEEALPEWFESVKPEEAPAMESQGGIEPSPATDEGLPDWLQSLQSEEQAAPLDSIEPQENLEPSPVTDEGLPDWLQSLQAEEQTAIPQEPAAVIPESLSDWQIDNEASVSGVTDVGSLGKSAAEQDDAVAWLESLASKHGAKPEELVTDPSARKETAPDWVQKAQEAAAQLPTEAEEPVQPEQEFEAPQESVPMASVAELGISAAEQDDAVAWLESLASKHGAKPEELVTDPSARKETAPDWVQKAQEAAAQLQPTAEEIAPAEEIVESEPEWMKHAKEVGESLFSELEEAQTKEPLPTEGTDETGMWLRDLGEEAGFEEKEPVPAAEGDIPDWLRGLDTDESEQGIAPAPEAVPMSESEAEPEPPDWLRSMESKVPDSDSVSVIESVEEVPETESEGLPSWLAGLEKEQEQQAAASDTGMPDWMLEETEEDLVQPQPTAPTDWQPVDKIEPVRATPPPPAPVEEPVAPPKPIPPRPEPPAPPERELYREPVTRSRSGMTGMLSMAQEPALVQAQNELVRGNIPGAMEQYEKLIKKGRFLDEIIFDLREALYRYPVEVNIHQTLGDAYMRANRLQDALDSYTKAEELLR